MRVDEHAMHLTFLDDADGGLASSLVGPPQLYVDQKTVVEEVRDLRALRKGDHCFVGLNCLRRLHWLLDSYCFFLGRWELFRFYHHFRMATDVASAERDPTTGLVVPRDAKGADAFIFEYSTTPAEAVVALLRDRGWTKEFIPFQRIPLRSYTDVAPASAAGAIGIFRVREPVALTDAARDALVEEAWRLTRNCKTS
jgi:hypothetical protein